MCSPSATIRRIVFVKYGRNPAATVEDPAASLLRESRCPCVTRRPWALLFKADALRTEPCIHAIARSR
jgi:hypothetical protein